MKLAHACLALGLMGCLPEDTRTPPGRLAVTLRSDYVPANGIDTDDGWHIEYERFLVSLGDVELRGDDCTQYNETDYSRVFDARLGTSQKISTPFALGACDFQFRMRPPPQDAVLGENVSESDLAFLRLPDTDAFAEDSGAALFVAGVATRPTITKRFSWAFRLGAQYEDCKLQGETGVELGSQDQQSVEIVIKSAALFQHLPNDVLAELRFSRFAAADDVFGDKDGDISIDELILEPISGPGFERWSTFGEYVYTGLAPKLPRFRDTGICSVGPIVEGGHGPGGGGH